MTSASHSKTAFINFACVCITWHQCCMNQWSHWIEHCIAD